MSLPSIAFDYLKTCNIKVSGSFLEQNIISHHNYPSLVSLTDTLDLLGLKYKAVEAEEKHILHFSFPFLAHTPKAVGNFEIVTSMDYYENNKQNFLNRWEGIAVMVEKGQVVKNDDHEKLLKRERLTELKTKIGIGVTLLILLSVQFLNFNTPVFLFTLLNIAGIFICSLIILHKRGKGNAITRQLCSTGKSHGCDLVLNSKASQIVKGIDFGDVGLIYFATQLLLISISSITSIEIDAMTLLGIPGVLALLFAFYSFFYQWRVAKAWCRMCMITIGLVLLQAFVLVFHFYLDGFGLADSFLPVVILFIFSFLIASSWILIKGLIGIKLKSKKLETEVLKWKRNPEIFHSLLTNQPIIDTSILDNPLRIGRAGTPLQFTIVSNPFCGPCASAHKQFENLFKKYPNIISFEVILIVKSATDREDRRTIADERILNAGFDCNNTLEIMHDWFELMSIERFDEKYGTVKPSSQTQRVLNNYEHWLSNNVIPHTPFIYLNGYKLPKQYGINDMEFLIADLMELLAPTKMKHHEEVADISWQ